MWLMDYSVSHILFKESCMPKLTEEKHKKVIDGYTSGMTQRDAGKEAGIGRDAVKNILVRFGVPVRKYTGERISNQSWSWDFDFFTRTNPTVAYWAGFLMADGNISNKGNIMALVIQGGDIDHIKSFCKDILLDTSAIFKDSKWNAYGVHLNYKRLGEQLNPWGIVPRKSKNFHTPTVPEYILPHYLRGWIDGDGSVYRYGRSARISVSSGNKESLEWFADSLSRIGYNGHIGIRESGNKRYPGNYLLYIGGVNQVSQVANILMVDNYFCMKRKWSKTYIEKRTKVAKICEICESEFFVDKYRAEKEPQNGRFCSRVCFHEHERRMWNPVIEHNLPNPLNFTEER
jgi:hypothetical protein